MRKKEKIEKMYEIIFSRKKMKILGDNFSKIVGNEFVLFKR